MTRRTWVIIALVALVVVAVVFLYTWNQPTQMTGVPEGTVSLLF